MQMLARRECKERVVGMSVERDWEGSGEENVRETVERDWESLWEKEKVRETSVERVDGSEGDVGGGGSGRSTEGGNVGGGENCMGGGESVGVAGEEMYIWYIHVGRVEDKEVRPKTGGHHWSIA